MNNFLEELFNQVLTSFSIIELEHEVIKYLLYKYLTQRDVSFDHIVNVVRKHIEKEKDIISKSGMVLYTLNELENYIKKELKEYLEDKINEKVFIKKLVVLWIGHSREFRRIIERTIDTIDNYILEKLTI